MMILPPEHSDKPTTHSRVTWHTAAYYAYDAAGHMEHAKSAITDLGTADYGIHGTPCISIEFMMVSAKPSDAASFLVKKPVDATGEIW